MVELYILGTTELRRDGAAVEDFLKGPKRSGLLAYLALSRPRGFRRRDQLLPLFWPELDQQSARNALSNMLYHIRRMLGEDVVANRGLEDLGIHPDSFWCDAVAFDAALEADEAERALKYYRGDLLEGFYVPDAAPQFHQWLDEQRERLRLRAAKAAWLMAETAEQANDTSAARRWARKAAAFTPYSDDAHLRLIALLDRTGDRIGALQIYEGFASRLHDEWQMNPSPEVESIAASIRSRSRSGESLRRAAPASERTIAVLPFETLGTDSDTAFTDGLHGDILVRLSTVADLQVISRTSVRRYRDTEKSIPQIGAELNAAWAVEGDVQKAGDEVQVRIRLVDTRADRQVWAKRFHRALTADNFFQIQSEVTKTIAASLKARLTPAERRRVEGRPTDDLDAYRFFVLGRRSLDERTASGMRRALEYFEQALALDGEFVLAWVGLADARALLFDYGHESDAAVLSHAAEDVQKALALEPNSAEARASLGLIHSIRHEGSEAVEELERAVELRPNYAEAHNWLSWVHILLGNRTEARESARLAVTLNPLSPEAMTNLVFSHLINGDPDKALVEARREHELGSSWGSGRFLEGLALYQLGRFDEALAVLENLEAPWAGSGPRSVEALARTASGDTATARQALSAFEAAGDVFAAAVVRAALGDERGAFDGFLQVDDFGHWPTIAVRHFLRDLWRLLPDGPRYHELLARVDRSWGRQSSLAYDSAAADPRALAVLPFDDLAGRDDPGSFAAGLHNDLLTRLSRVDQLTVISRSSVLRCHEDGSSIQEIAQRLGAGTVVEGSIQRMGDRLRLNVQVTDTRDERLRWAETYDRGIHDADVFDVQAELVGKITADLERQLSPVERRQVARKPTTSLDAYRLYTHGRAVLDRRTEEAFREAYTCFEDAIEMDADFALAWSGLSDALSLLAFYGFPAIDDSVTSEKAARRALRIDPESGEAHTSLGIVHSLDHRGEEARQNFEHAVALMPGYAEAHVWLSWLHLLLGSPSEALEAARRGVRLNPLAPAYRVFFAETLLAAGDAREALLEARRAREIQPAYGLAHYMEALALFHDQRYPEAAAALEQALPLVPETDGTPTRAEIKAVLAAARMATGDMAAGFDLAGQVEKAGEPFAAGLVRAALRQTDAALSSFETIERWRPLSTECIRYFFPGELAAVREDARFEFVLRSVDRSWTAAPGTVVR